MKLLGDFFSIIFNFCLSFSNNYWIAIIVFTLLSKVILLPVSIIVQKNSIKMVKMYPHINRIKTKYFGNGDMISEKQYELYKKENYHPLFDIIPAIIQVAVLMGVVKGFPEADINNSIIMTILAGLSSFILCEVQNKANVLQQEQSKTNQIGIMIFSICLSLFLAIFVTKYVVFYWICSNLMSAIQVFILNFFINPKKYIDYEDLENSKRELDAVKEQNAKIKIKRSRELVNRENNDYKRFLKYENKQIVFYSEKNGFYKYYKDIIEIILKKTDIVIHYISSDPNDEIFKLTKENFQTYYIEEKLMILMMRMDADIVVMTTPDLQNYYIKRSMVRDDIEYVYIDHSTNSNNLTYHKDALAHFDTIFVQNTKNYEEIKAQEQKYNFKTKNLVKVGFPLIDNMIESYGEQKNDDKKTILIAPSWQEDNILDSCIDNLLDELLDTDYDVIVRPHPQYVKLYGEKLELIRNKFSKYNNFILQTDFSSNNTVYDADILITDWSAICFEYSFTTLKPVLFINTPMKVINPNYKDINIIPFDIEARSQIGIEVELDNINSIKDKLKELETSCKYTKGSIRNIRDSYLYNIGNSAKYGAKYLVDSLIEKSKNVSKEEQVITNNPNDTKNSFIKKVCNTFNISVFVCLTLFFFSPMEIYLGNYSDFIFPIDNVWWIMLIFSLIISFVMAIFISLFKNRVYKLLCLILFSSALLCYIQMLFLNGDVVSLLSNNKEVLYELSTCLINLCIWILVFVSIIVLYFKFKTINNNLFKIVSYLSACLIVIQLFGYFASYNKLPEKHSKINYLTSQGEFELGNENNTIVFIIDTCDDYYVNNTLKEYPDLFSSLDGFTYYPNAVGRYSRTYPSLVYLLTGNECHYDIPWEDYIEESWDNTSYFNNLKSKKYNTGIYTDVVYLGSKAKENVDNMSEYNCYDISKLDVEALIKEMVVLSANRCSPYFIKNFISNKYPPSVDRIFKMPTDDCIQEDDALLYSMLVKKGLTKNNNYSNSFRLYHLYGNHGWLNEDVTELNANDEKSSSITLYADFKIIKEYIKEMKKIGIYDKSTIVITADHGLVRGENKHATGIPIMLIKYPNAIGDIKTSDLAISHKDLLFLLYEQENEEDYIKRLKNNTEQRKLYIAHLGSLYEYDINGDVRDPNSWKLNDKVLKVKYSINSADLK